MKDFSKMDNLLKRFVEEGKLICLDFYRESITAGLMSF